MVLVTSCSNVNLTLSHTHTHSHAHTHTNHKHTTHKNPQICSWAAGANMYKIHTYTLPHTYTHYHIHTQIYCDRRAPGADVGAV